MFNKNKFRGKIVEKGLTIEDMAQKLSINPATIHRKMNGNSDFSRTEIQKIVDILNLSSDEMNSIFFADELA